MNIVLEKCDITKQSVDCIVNAAHEALQGGGGVDGAIHRAAGSQLLTECRSLPFISPGIRCNVGNVKITHGYNLPAKFIIHTVAPKFIGAVYKSALMENIYKNAKPGTEKDLEACYINSLKMAKLSNSIKTIAFPSLGTGGHAWPVEVAAPIAIKALKQYGEHFELIKMCLFSDFDLKCYTEALNAA